MIMMHGQHYDMTCSACGEVNHARLIFGIYGSDDPDETAQIDCDHCGARNVKMTGTLTPTITYSITCEICEDTKRIDVLDAPDKANGKPLMDEMLVRNYVCEACDHVHDEVAAQRVKGS